MEAAQSHNFKMHLLKEVADLRGGFAFKSEQYSEQGHFVLRTVNITENGNIDKQKAVFIPERMVEEYESFMLKEGDILFVMVGATLGKVGFIRNDSLPALLNQNMWRIRAKSEIVDPVFLYYLFKEKIRELIFLSSGSARGFLRRDDCRNLKLRIPSLHRQKLVTRIISDFDDLNHSIKQEIFYSQEIISSLFRSWFIDFDPVKAKAEGRLPHGMNEETAALFPDSFADSELGPIPTGWRIDKIHGLIKRLKVGKKYDQWSVLEKGNIPVLDQGKKGIIGYHNETPGVIASLHSPVVIFCNHTCLMKLVTHPFSAIQNVLPFVGQSVDTTWAYFATRDKQEFTGYKGHWPDFIIHKLVVPPEELTKKFGQTVSNLIALIEQKNIITGSSESLRDVLLPLLLSGEISIS